MTKTTIGIDIGGTKTSGALVNREGEMFDKIERLTPISEGGGAVLSNAVEIAEALIGRSPSNIEGIGVASGGQIDPRTGEALYATDLIPGWKGMQIARTLENRFEIPAKAINDASAAALGEWKFGVAQGIDDFVCITIGTGVGGGIVSGGRLIEGHLGLAGSIGHIVIEVGGRQCNCGSSGCLEAYVSGTAIIARILELAESGVSSPLAERLKSGELPSAKILAEAQNDPLAIQAVHEAGEYLGWGIVSLLNLLNPAMAVIGGGVSSLGDSLLDPARKIAFDHSLRKASDPVRIVQAKLGNDAGILGAASLIWD